MNANQLELDLKAKQLRTAAARKHRRQQQAQWWFAQMRRVVASSMEWKPEKTGG